MFSKNKVYALLIGLIIYVVFGLITIGVVTHWMSDHYFDLLGSKALDIAKMTSVGYYMTDEEFRELKEIQFSELLTHPANERLSELFGPLDYSNELKYVYIWSKLGESEIKYYVDETDKDFYRAPVGQALDCIWLVDVVINNAQSAAQLEDDTYTLDKNRFSYFRDEDNEMYGPEIPPGYRLTSDEYGYAITGYTPLLTEEGNFVGLLCVDFYYESFLMHQKLSRIVLAMVFLLPTVVLSLAYGALYLLKIKKSDRSANIDHLTALYNRRFLASYLPDLMKRSVAAQTPVATIMIDIDYFKNYNDFYGHQKGDEAIIRVTSAIKSVLRSSTDVACRYGGEEMVVFLPNTTSENAIVVAEKIKHAVDELKIEHIPSEISDYLTISQGIYVQIPTSYSVDLGADYIRFADKALYRAKGSGRNCYELYRES